MLKKSVFLSLKFQFEYKRAESSNSDRAGLCGHYVYLDFVQLLLVFELELTKVKRVGRRVPFGNHFALYSHLGIDEILPDGTCRPTLLTLVSSNSKSRRSWTKSKYT